MQEPIAAQERVMFVVGAAGGIGAALCSRLRDRGFRLVLGGRSEAPLRELAGRVGGDVAPFDAGCGVLPLAAALTCSK